MDNSNLPKILTVEEIAEYLKTDKDIVAREIEEGRLRGFKLGLEWRCTDASLLEFINSSYTVSLTNREDNPRLNYEKTDFVEIEPFDFQWPVDKEHFDTGYETTRDINGHTYTFKIGFSNRQAAGQMRRRVVIWKDNWPLVEFAAGNNYEADGLLASVIKTKDGKQLRQSSKIPDEYRGFNIKRYDSVVQGPYASRNMAVIVKKDDLESMLQHAIIRAQWKGLI
jgi:excisionase family DNA binding protein